jgi:hypothetical protein
MGFAKHGASLCTFCAGWKLTPATSSQVIATNNQANSIPLNSFQKYKRIHTPITNLNSCERKGQTCDHLHERYKDPSIPQHF